MDFVWPYIYGPSFFRKGGIFNELDFSIRSVRKNYPNARCIVVGDDPKLDVIHIECPYLDTTRPNFRELDLINKFRTVAASDEIGEEFVLMCDDMFILQPVDDDELRKSYGREEITNVLEYARKRRGSMDYKRVWKSTYEFNIMLRYGKGLKTYDWECHLPRHVIKSRLKYIMKNFDLDNNIMLVLGLHDGHEVKDSELVYPGLQADLWTHRPGMDFDVELSKKYMNLYDDAIIPELIEKMETMFP